jgi:hypothetical protein
MESASESLLTGSNPKWRPWYEEKIAILRMRCGGHRGGGYDGLFKGPPFADQEMVLLQRTLEEGVLSPSMYIQKEHVNRLIDCGNNLKAEVLGHCQAVQEYLDKFLTIIKGLESADEILEQLGAAGSFERSAHIIRYHMPIWEAKRKETLKSAEALVSELRNAGL